MQADDTDRAIAEFVAEDYPDLRDAFMEVIEPFGPPCTPCPITIGCVNGLYCPLRVVFTDLFIAALRVTIKVLRAMARNSIDDPLERITFIARKFE